MNAQGEYKMNDIRFNTDSYYFSYRAAGIVVVDGKVLLQKPIDGNDYALPGGGVKLGETCAETLKREFSEEIGTDIEVGKLRWVEECFWTWDGKPNHNISLYFDVRFTDSVQIPLNGCFASNEPHLEFNWVAIENLGNLTVYPERMTELLRNKSDSVEHWVRRETKP